VYDVTITSYERRLKGDMEFSRIFARTVPYDRPSAAAKRRL
jgi:hypothetical protein